MKSPNTHRSLSGTRTAFTMVELLVVIGIISLLATIAITAMAPSLENAKIAATKATIAQINEVIQQRLDAISQLDVSSEAKKLAALNSPMTQLQAEFLIKSILYRQALPQRPGDLDGLNLQNDGGASSTDDAPLRLKFTLDSASSNSDYLNSAVLYAALTEGSQLRVLPNGKSYRVAVLDPDAINAKHLTVIDLGSGFSTTAFVDAWGQPLRFYNWPTRLIRPSGTTIDLTNAKFLIAGLPTDTSTNGANGTDPLDPSGRLATSPLTGMTQLTLTPSGTPQTVVRFNEDNYRTLNTFYTPLLMSCGPDQSPGLNEPTASSPDHLGTISNVADIYDNITNRQQ